MFNERNVRRFRPKRHRPQRLRDGMRIRIHSDVRYAWHPVIKENVGVVGELIYAGRDWCTVKLPGYAELDLPTCCLRAV